MALLPMLLRVLLLGCWASRAAGGSKKPHIVVSLQDDLGHYEYVPMAHPCQVD